MISPGNAILLISCPDQKGIVARLSNFIFENGGNIVHSDQHTDPEAGIFFIRLEWELGGFRIPPEKITTTFTPIAKQFKMHWELRFSSTIPRMAIFASKSDHCLIDLLLRQKAGEIRAEIPLVVNNHDDLKSIAKQFGIPFHAFPMSSNTKKSQEEKERALLKKSKIDFVVLARYMQILSKDFVAAYPNRIINIHHSFLPAFTGGKPYHQAYQRGVKVIGATSHYVTEKLDDGPIIEQDVVRISHRDSVDELIRKGKDLEKIVLSRAVRLHVENRILVYGNKTVVFD